MNAIISRDNMSVTQLPAQTYVANPKDNQLVLFTSFDLKPEAEWSHSVSFINYFDRNEEKEYREAEINLKNEILRQKNEYGDKHFAIAPLEIVEPFNNLFDKKFKWLAGEYLLEVSIETGTPKANISKKYRFTIFESQTDSLIEHKKGYASGATIYWESADYVGQWIEVGEKNG
jgi:hypothetical protein